MAEISWTREAERWLRDIYEYIALDNPTAAAEVINGIYHSVQQRTEFPELGYRYHGSVEIRCVFYSTVTIVLRT